MSISKPLCGKIFIGFRWSVRFYSVIIVRKPRQFEKEERKMHHGGKKEGNHEIPRIYIYTIYMKFIRKYLFISSYVYSSWYRN